MAGKVRWAVRVETYSLLAPICDPPSPTVRYEYHRWRWKARLSVWMVDGAMPYGLCFFVARLLGKVTIK